MAEQQRQYVLDVLERVNALPIGQLVQHRQAAAELCETAFQAGQLQRVDIGLRVPHHACERMAEIGAGIFEEVIHAEIGLQTMLVHYLLLPVSGNMVPATHPFLYSFVSTGP